ncbi:serine/threonine-protein kinase [Streptomyces sp. NPDC058755]|uniref:serine/threonine-protein kinase n=1 Tax=Streptomyces sp. NPDC058755 TaxID=3346624 RepID=UPI0036898D0C
MQPLSPDDPARIGPYRLLSRLGAGGMGRVYLAREADAGPGATTVAVKLIRTDPDAEQDEFRRRFTREVAAARRVSGAWTARVLDADTDAEQPWVATEYVPGPTLRAVVRGDFGALPSASAHVLAHRLAQALDAIHGAGLVHRDLKPSNILLTVDGPRVIDFGVAHAVDATSTITRSGSLVGTPEFMSPEQVRGERVTAAGDVFSLGSVLVYAATGRSPFQGAGEGGVHALLFRIAYEQPELSGVPEVLRALVLGCLAKDPVDRPTVPELVELTRRAPEGAWLPAELLRRLDRVAAEPVPEAPRLDEAVTEEPEFPDFPDFPKPLEALRHRDPLDLPELGITPPRILRTPPSRRVLVRRRFASTLVGLAGTLSVGLAAAVVWPTITEEGPQSEEPLVVHSEGIMDILFGERQATARNYLGQSSLTLRLSVYSTGDIPYLAATPEAVCTGTLRMTDETTDTLTLTRHSRAVVLPEDAPRGLCPELGTIRLRKEGDEVVWLNKWNQATGLTLAGRPGDPVPSAFVGTRTSRGWSVRVAPGSIGAPLVTGTRQISGRHCTWRAVVLDANNVLTTTPAVLDPAHSDVGCEAPAARLTLRRNEVSPQPTAEVG